MQASGHCPSSPTYTLSKHHVSSLGLTSAKTSRESASHDNQKFPLRGDTSVPQSPSRTYLQWPKDLSLGPEWWVHAASQPESWMKNPPFDRPTSVSLWPHHLCKSHLPHCMVAYRIPGRTLSFPLWNSNLSLSISVLQVVLAVKWV